MGPSGHYRFVVLAVSTLCLSMMLANLLTLNFTILCMTERRSGWEPFTIDLGSDVFERVDFFTPRRTSISPDPRQRPLDADSLDVPGIRVGAPGFNWHTTRLAVHNPQLFTRIIKSVIWEASQRAARAAGEEFDPRRIDYFQFRNGFNLTDLDESVGVGVREYLLRKVRYARDPNSVLDAQGRSVNQWRMTPPEDIQIRNITWNGVIQGQILSTLSQPDYTYSPSEKAMLFAAVAVGALLCIYPISYGIQHIGCRKTFLASQIVSAISTALCPLAASFHFWVFVAVRCIQGVGFAACFPVVGAVTSSWASLKENGLFNGALTGFIQLGPVISMPLAGLLCSIEWLRWPSVYYAHAIITALLAALWWFGYRDRPSDHPKVNITELRAIQSGKRVVVDGREKHNRRPFPLREICSSAAVWAIWMAAVGNMYGIQMLVLFAPTYIKEVLRYPLIAVGFAAAAPTLFQFAVKLMAGIASDRLKGVGETCKLRIFNSIAFCGMALFFLSVALMPNVQENDKTVLVLLILAATVLGFNAGGFFKSATLVGRQYSHFINANVQIIMCISMLTVPFFVFWLTPNNTASEWSTVFILDACLLLLCNVIFCLLGSGEPAPFTNQQMGTTEANNARNGNREQAKPMMTPAAVATEEQKA